MRGNTHVRFGGRPGETDRQQCRHRAPGRPNLERVNKEIKRRTDVVGVFPNPAALLRLAGAVLVETHDEVAVHRPTLSVRRVDGPARPARNREGGSQGRTPRRMIKQLAERNTMTTTYTIQRDVPRTDQ